MLSLDPFLCIHSWAPHGDAVHFCGPRRPARRANGFVENHSSSVAMTVAALVAIASAGFVAPGALSISTASSRPVRALSPMASGGDLAAVDHEDAVEISLTGGQPFLFPTNSYRGQTSATGHDLHDPKGVRLRTPVEYESSYIEQVASAASCGTRARACSRSRCPTCSRPSPTCRACSPRSSSSSSS